MKATHKYCHFLICALVPGSAYAHGEDILLPLGLHMFVIVICCLGITVVPSPLKLKLQLFGGLFVGAVLAWIVTANILTSQSLILLTVVYGGLPLAGIALTYAVFRGRNR